MPSSTMNLKPFYFLDKQISILLVDDDPGVLGMLSDVFSPLGLYDVQCASSARQAEEQLRSAKRTHSCVLDLGIDDIKGDEFFLLKKFGNRASFVIFTGRQSSSKGFDAHRFGAKAVVEKSGEFDQPGFLKIVDHCSLLNIINPKYTGGKGSLNVSTDVLFEKSPRFVSQWAQLIGLTDRALRLVWTKNLGANAKIILSMHDMFRASFDYYETLVKSGEVAALASVPPPQSYRRMEEYFHIHKSTITDFVSYGHVAALVQG